MNFAVRHNNTDYTADELGLAAARILRKKSAADEFRATFADPTKAEFLKTGDTVEIFKNGVRKFRGTITRLDFDFGGGDDRALLVAKNAWFDLESIVYQQFWKTATNGVSSDGTPVLVDISRSKVVLGQDSASLKIGAAQQLADIFSYAISKGAEFAVGEISADCELPLDEARDLTCAEAAARVLKWLPDAGAFFDYSADGLPTLSVLPKSALQTKTIELGSGKIKRLKVGSRPDLAVSSVSIKYESEHSDGAQSWLTVHDDTYPQDRPAGGKNAVVMSIDLAGLKGSTQIYEIVCQSIQADVPAWWRRRIPALSDASDLQVLSYSRGENSQNLPRFLVSGTIHPSMNFRTFVERVDAVVQYTDENSSVVRKKIGVRFVTTNAVSGTYTTSSASQAAEPIPTGLAKAVYDSSREIQYEGFAEIFGADAADFCGAKIRIGGGHSDWATMDSPVSSVSENLADDTLLVKFGPPTHLYPDKIAELFRIGRPRNTPASYTQKSGAVSASNRIYFSGINSESDGGQGDASYAKFVVSETDGGTIELNAQDLSASQTAQMREVYLTKNGYLAKAHALLTEPQEVE